MLNGIHPQHPNLLERPSRQRLGKLPIRSHSRLVPFTSNLGTKPLILQHLRRAQDNHTRRIARLERRHETQLRASTEQLIWVDNLALLLRVVAVSRPGCAHDGRQELASAEGVTDGMREREHGAFAADGEEGLDAGADGRRGVEDEDVVLLGGGDGVVVEVVDDETCALDGEGDAELVEEGYNRRG